ncbi:MAG: hypothetical protein RLZZ435_2851 [Cyanobacteriota bacterium]
MTVPRSRHSILVAVVKVYLGFQGASKIEMNQTISAVTASPRPRALRLVALGDSLVYGYGDTEGGGWVDRLRCYWMRQALEDPHSLPSPVLYNLGVRGDTIDLVSRRLEAEFKHRGEYRNRVPDGILLSVGTNDSPRVGQPDGKNYTDFDRFQRMMETLLERSLELAPIVYFVGMVPVDSYKMPFLDLLYYNHSDQYRYKEVTRQLCRSLGIPYLDLFEQWLSNGDQWWRSRLSEDGLHPNHLGYASIFEAVLAWKDLQQELAHQ